MDPVIYSFFLASGILLGGYLASLLLDKYGIPDPIILIGLGMVIGPILKLVNPTQLSGLASHLGALALVAIMFESSLGINIHELIGSAKAALTLAIASFSTSMVMVALIMHYLFSLTWVESFLFGSVIGGSSGAVIAAIVNKLNIEAPLPLILSIESLLTDVLCIITAVLIGWIIISPSGAIENAASFVAAKFSTSVVIGFIFGLILASVIYKLRKRKHTYTAIFSSLIFLYAFSEFLGGNGAIAVLVCGIILSNIEYLPSYLSSEERIETIKFQRIFLESFHSELTLLIKVFFFVEIGLLFNITDPVYLLIATFLAIVLLITRFPISYLISPMTGGRRNAPLITVFYARGLAAAVLAIQITTRGELVTVLTNPEFFLQTISGVVVITNLILTIAYLILKRQT